MRAFMNRIFKTLISFAFSMTELNLNRTCWFGMYQPILPEEAERLRHI